MSRHPILQWDDKKLAPIHSDLLESLLYVGYCAIAEDTVVTSKLDNIFTFLNLTVY